MPDLSSLTPTTFGLRDADIPIEYSLGATTRRVLPPQNAGLIVGFAVKRIHALTGRLTTRHAALASTIENRLAAFWTADLGRPRAMPIGHHGLFYLEDVVAGHYLVTVKLPEGQCSVLIEVPETEEPAWDIGEIACEIEAGS
jgi:outer membrane usher protein FimD/PapC